MLAHGPMPVGECETTEALAEGSGPLCDGSTAKPPERSNGSFTIVVASRARFEAVRDEQRVRRCEDLGGEATVAGERCESSWCVAVR